MKRRAVKIANVEKSALEAIRSATSFDGWINTTGWSEKAILEVDGVGKEIDGVDLYNGRANNIDLSQNGLTGRLPDVFARFTQITELFLNDNALTGPVPPSISECPKLRVLNLADNQLSGRVHSGLWKLLKVEVIYLHNNKLSGDIDEWIKGTVAWEVRVDGNQFNAPLLRHGRFSKEAVDLRSIKSMREYIEERLKEEGGDIKLWAVDRLNTLMNGLTVNVNVADQVYADNKLVPVKKKLPVGSGKITIVDLENLQGYVEKVKVKGVIEIVFLYSFALRWEGSFPEAEESSGGPKRLTRGRLVFSDVSSQLRTLRDDPHYLVHMVYNAPEPSGAQQLMLEWYLNHEGVHMMELVTYKIEQWFSEINAEFPQDRAMRMCYRTDMETFLLEEKGIRLPLVHQDTV